jgi:hypothetical protein
MCNFSASLRVKLTCVTVFGTKTRAKTVWSKGFEQEEL